MKSRLHSLAPATLLLIINSPACGAGSNGTSQSAPVLVAGEPSVVEEAPAAAEFDQEHSLWTRVLKDCVRDDAFDYARLARNRDPLDAYLKELHAVTPEQLSSWTKEQRFAFWINAYNAHTIRLVIENYPLDSIRDLDGVLGLKSVFDREFIPMAAHHPDGKDDRLSLNDIENGILRKEFEDARVHAAINCASISCPPLREEAFVAPRLEDQLDDQMRRFVNDPERNHIDVRKDELQISEIFKWFAEDFERDAETVRGFLLRYTPPEAADLVRKAHLHYIDYDWDLNDVPRERG